MTDAVAVVLFVAITAYAVFGGADFGAGFWDLVAGGAKRGARPRQMVDHSIGPVWEANHVWLIFSLVVLWTGFSEAFQSIMLTLFVPLALAAFGIVLRGASFAFRHSVVRSQYQRWFGAVFASSSVLVPFCMGAVAGAIASGRVPAGGVAGDRFTSWINPTSVLGGVMAITVTAYLAAVFMIVEAGRLGERDLVEYFRVRAVVAAIVAGAVAAIGVFVLYVDADYLFHGLTSRALPLVIASVVFGLSSLFLLHRGRAKLARPLAMGAVVTVMLGWGVAQYDYILPESLTIDAAASPSGTMGAILVVFVAFVVFVAPSIALLYRLDQKSLLETDAAEYAADS